MRLVPCTVKKAQRYVRIWHRHLKRVQGGLFAVALADDAGELVGVAIAGNPSRVWQGRGRFYITRCATNGARNACGTGPKGETCGTCAHAVRCRRYAKCGLNRPRWTHGIKTDIRLRTAACDKWVAA
jgi:hypothetical protein